MGRAVKTGGRKDKRTPKDRRDSRALIYVGYGDGLSLRCFDCVKRLNKEEKWTPEERITALELRTYVRNRRSCGTCGVSLEVKRWSSKRNARTAVTRKARS